MDSLEPVYYLNYNPDEIAFYRWSSFAPDAPHPTSDKLFLEFVLTVASYKEYREKWENPEYFFMRCRQAGIHNETFIDRRFFFLQMYLCIERYEARPTKKKNSAMCVPGFRESNITAIIMIRGKRN